MNVVDIVQQVEFVFVLFDLVIQLKVCIDDFIFSVDDVVDIIVFDLFFIFQLFKIVNSVIYQFLYIIDIIIKVIQVIGIKVIYDMVLFYGVFYIFKEIDILVIDMDCFWEQCVSCVLLSKYFVELKCICGLEKLFVVGLFYNVGELVMVRFYLEKVK